MINSAEPLRPPAVPLVGGALAAALLIAIYLGLVAWAQDWSHARELMWGDRYFVGAIALGFGTQVGLYLYIRQIVHRRRLAASSATVVAGTGTSSVAMVACCAHHLTDVLPLVGLSGLAVFLGDYRIPLMALGIGVNTIGGAVMLRPVVRERRFRALAEAPLAERA